MAGDRYSWGYHSSDETSAHVSLGGRDLFDVALYDPEVVEEDGRTALARSLDELKAMVGRANEALDAADRRSGFVLVTLGIGPKIVEETKAVTPRFNAHGDLACPECGNDDMSIYADDGESATADWWDCQVSMHGCGAFGALARRDDPSLTLNGLAVS